MSQQYQVLARKYRPKNFHELVGQSHVSKALINAIDYNRLHHAYLFTGTRGVGKTTIARILSKCLNCETGITSTPCGVCSICVAIDAGRFIDLIEIDAASRTKVEDTRELIDNVPYAPTQGRFKVYLIDEVHMLSTHSFNALLKTLEEPPAHVKFLLATTDPQKLPITIISRCLQFVLRPLPQQAISHHLAKLLDKENVTYTDSALWQLANAAKGSVRDALSLTDQAIAFGQGGLTDDTVNDMLGLIDNADLVQLLTDIYQGNTDAVSVHIEKMRAQLVDAGSMFDGLAELLHQLAMVQLLPTVTLNMNEQQAQSVTKLAHHLDADIIQLYYQIIIQGREQIKLANTPLQALEMCLLRLLAFRPLAVNEVTVTKYPSNIEQPPSYKKTSEQHTPREAAPLEATPQEAKSTISVSEEIASAELTPALMTSANELSQSVMIDSQLSQDELSQNESQENFYPQSSRDLVAQTQTLVSSDTPNHPHTSVTHSRIANQTVQTDRTAYENIAGNPNSVHPNIVHNEITNGYDDKNNSNEVVEERCEESPLPPLEASQIIEPIEPLRDQTNQSTATSTPNNVKSNDIAPVSPAEELSQTDFSSKVLFDAETDPRTLLNCTPVPLNGEWTPEKWDYWLQTARQSGKLGHDELALARQGVMTGDINGVSEFRVVFDTKNMNNIFKHLSSHLSTQFGAQVSISVDDSLATDNRLWLPEVRQKHRSEKAIEHAKVLLMRSPVMQKLAQESYAKITNLKLNT